MTSLPPASPNPDRQSQLPQPHEGYGYRGAYGASHISHYSGGGYYGHPGGGADGQNPDGQQTRTMQDYFVMLRERVWYLVLTILVCGISSAIYTFNQTPEYMAAAKLRVTRMIYDIANTSGTGQLTEQMLNREDFMTQVMLMNSLSVITKVSNKLPQTLRTQVLEPYQDGNIFTGPLRDTDVIMQCYSVKPTRDALIVNISYTHPDKEIARQLAGYFAEAIVDNNREDRSSIVTPAIEQMSLQLEQQKAKITGMYNARSELIKKDDGLVGITAKINTASSELTSAIQDRKNDQKIYDDAKSLWEQLQKLKKEGIPTTNLSAVASNERVMSMESEVSKQAILVEGLKRLFTVEHPKLTQTLSQLEKAKEERAGAVVAAEAKIEQTYLSAKRNFEASKIRADEVNQKMIELTDASGKLESVEKEIVSAETLYNTLNISYATEKLKAANNATNIRIVESPMLVSNKPINRNWFVNCGVGIGAGIALGCAIIFGLAFLDDRVKSSTDIENFLGLSLIGVLPVASRMNSFRKARVVATGDDRTVVEGFRAIYSALKINEAARTAKAFLTTSTTPSEGKSFVTTNLAMTFAMHGEKVLIIDADLRMPAVGKSLQLEGNKGITRYFQGGVSLDDSIHRDVVPNLDVLTVGDPCRNPTQVLNSRRFADMIAELKGKYDRIFLDSPPVGAVSDSLNLLPQVDGVIYVVRFNTVKRRFIKSNIRRLQESKVPVFGAVLNQIGLRVARYYTNTGDRAYAKYYNAAGKDAIDVKV